jgi:hypothetical protein
MLEELPSCPIFESRRFNEDAEEIEEVSDLPLLELIRRCVIADRQPIQSAGISWASRDSARSHGEAEVGLMRLVIKTPKGDA